MVDNVDAIEKAEQELWQIIEKMHKQGVRYSVVHFILAEIVKTLELQSYTEDWLEMYNQNKSL